jgi:ABC-type branched-subunit amino acid transport system permease subunit
MPLLNMRELLQFPGGDNETDTIINGVHFNLTALERFKYSYYSNGTLSNSSKCYLIFDNFKPFMHSNNGSFVNATTCYIPYYSIHGRGIASIVFASFFCLSIMFTLINLRKHGRLHLREDKRFRVVGRRWQWYWLLFVAACGMISTLTGVDVDRYYLQQIPIILQSFFFVLMVPGILAAVWEGTRHWWVINTSCKVSIGSHSTGDHGKRDKLLTASLFHSHRTISARRSSSGYH